MQDTISSSLKSRPPRIFSMYLKYIILKEFSLEQEPHIIVVTITKYCDDEIGVGEILWSWSCYVHQLHKISRVF